MQRHLTLKQEVAQSFCALCNMNDTLIERQAEAAFIIGEEGSRHAQSENVLAYEAIRLNSVGCAVWFQSCLS